MLRKSVPRRTFETNLSASQKEEMANQQAYEDLKVAKEAEIKAGEEQRDTKTQELADTDQKLAQVRWEQNTSMVIIEHAAWRCFRETLQLGVLSSGRAEIEEFFLWCVGQAGPRGHAELALRGPEVPDEPEGDVPDDGRRVARADFEFGVRVCPPFGASRKANAFSGLLKVFEIDDSPRVCQERLRETCMLYTT